MGDNIWLTGGLSVTIESGLIITIPMVDNRFVEAPYSKHDPPPAVELPVDEIGSRGQSQ